MFDSISNDGVKRPGTREMTAMLAGLMALNAFAIDAMVPALPAIGRSLNVLQENDRQLVVVVLFCRLRLDPIVLGAAGRPVRSQAGTRRWESSSTASSPCSAPLPAASRC